MEHGYAKLARGPDSFASILHALGMPAPQFLPGRPSSSNSVGGLAVFVGLFIPLASLPMIAVLVVATVTVHLQNGFSSIKLLAVTATGPNFGQPGFETDLLYMACLIALTLGGSGPFAVGTFMESIASRRYLPDDVADERRDRQSG